MSTPTRAPRTAQHQAALDLVALLLELEPDELEETLLAVLAAAHRAQEARGEADAAPWRALAGLADAVYEARLRGERPDPRAIAGALGGVVRALDALDAPAEWGRHVTRQAVAFQPRPLSEAVLAAIGALARALAGGGPDLTGHRGTP